MPFAQNTKIYDMNRLERNIIVGSLLGYGSFDLYGRSKNAYYREHGCTKQVHYRECKAYKLENLDFKILTSCKNPQPRFPSNRVYTNLYNTFYINGEKTIKLLQKKIYCF